MKKVILFFILFLSILVPLSVSAADIKYPDSSGNIVISKEESYRNLYTGGGSVDLKGETKGDFIAAGGTLFFARCRDYRGLFQGYLCADIGA